MCAGFTNPDYLYRLARSGSAEDREMLAKSVTSLLNANLNKGEMFLAQDILMHLLREAEMDLRQTLAMHLSVEEKCPQALIDFLIFECPIQVAEPILKNSPILDDEYLIEVAKRFDMPEYWRAIAARPNVSKNLALFLIGMDDEQVYQILVKNQGSEFCSLCMNWLTGIAMNLPPLQEPLIQRKEITTELATKLYWYTSDELKKQIMQRFDIDKAILDKTFSYVVSRRIEQKNGIQEISHEMLDLSAKMKAQGKITTQQIIATIQKGDRAFFACLCATYLDINPTKVMEKLKSRPMIALAVLSRCINLTRAEYNTLFLIWRRQENPSSTTNAKELTHAMAVYDQMKIDQAKAEVKTWVSGSQNESIH
jgi:uncharacterized protein (DUF2336 family)